jgi:hypothetical protein
MKSSRLLFASPFVLALATLLGTQEFACSGSLAPAGPLDGGSDDGSYDAGSLPETAPPPVPDSAVGVCPLAKKGGMEDFIDFCFQQSMLITEHGAFDPMAGMPSSWNASTGKPDTDGGVVVHDVRDDVAYAASLATYSISAEAFGDTAIKAWIVVPDLTALAALLEAELASPPASYDGELYMRLRRIAAGMRVVNLSTDADKIDALATAYGTAIYTNYFQAVVPLNAADAGAPDAAAPDAGSADAGSSSDAGDDAAPDAASDAASPAPPILNDAILGVPSPTGGIAYDVDHAASGALALADLASRVQGSDAGGANASSLQRAAMAVLNHIYQRARHSSGLYYSDLVTSADPDHDAVALLPDGVTPNDVLLADTQASVAASLTRLRALVPVAQLNLLSTFPFGPPIASPLNGLVGVAPAGAPGGGPVINLWDSTPNAAATTACASIPDAAACGGSGFFARYVPATGLDNTTKPLRANALAYAALHRAVVDPGTAAAIDIEPLSALFESQVGPSFISLLFRQTSYFAAVKGDLSQLTSSYSTQANAYAIEAMTEQWIGRPACPTDFY